MDFVQKQNGQFTSERHLFPSSLQPVPRDVAALLTLPDLEVDSLKVRPRAGEVFHSNGQKGS
jgi:hypothetical protein